MKAKGKNQKQKMSSYNKKSNYISLIFKIMKEDRLVRI